MGSKLAIGTGLLAGILVGGLAVGGAVALLPPPPTPVLSTASPAAFPTPTPQPTAAPAASSAVPSPTSSATGGSQPTASPTASGQASPGVGQAAPNLKLTTVDGGTLDLKDLRGKPVWVAFMATWCPACRDELPLMQGFGARYASDGLSIVLVDVQESAAGVAAYLKSLGVTLPTGLDTNGQAAAAWKAAPLPVHFWLTPDGVIAARAVGSIGPDVMAQKLQTILPAVTVTP